MDLFNTLTFVEILKWTTFLGTLSLIVPLVRRGLRPGMKILNKKERR